MLRSFATLLLMLPSMQAAEAPVIKADHAVLSASSDDEARALIGKFTNDLGLPMAWPLEKHGVRMSGGVFLGNFVLEIAVWPQVEPYQLLGLALEVRDTAAAFAELQSRGLTVKVQDRETGFFQIATVTQLAGEGLGIFLCKANPAWSKPHPQFKGGPAGITGVAQIDIGMNAARRADFEKLIAPAKPADWDPPIAILDGRYQIQAVKIKCREPELARKALPAGLPIVFVP